MPPIQQRDYNAGVLHLISPSGSGGGGQRGRGAGAIYPRPPPPSPPCPPRPHFRPHFRPYTHTFTYTFFSTPPAVVVQKAPPTPISGNLPPIGRRLCRGGDRGRAAWMGAEGSESGTERPRHAAWMGAERSGATKARRMVVRGA